MRYWVTNGNLIPETISFNTIFDAKHYLKVATFDKKQFALTLEEVPS